jgi:hypothetical protein
VISFCNTQSYTNHLYCLMISIVMVRHITKQTNKSWQWLKTLKISRGSNSNAHAKEVEQSAILFLYELSPFHLIDGP